MDEALIERLAYRATLDVGAEIGDPGRDGPSRALWIQTFASLVAEECAKLCESRNDTIGGAGCGEYFAECIRAKFKEPSNG